MEDGPLVQRQSPTSIATGAQLRADRRRNVHHALIASRRMTSYITSTDGDPAGVKTLLLNEGWRGKSEKNRIEA